MSDINDAILLRKIRNMPLWEILKKRTKHAKCRMHFPSHAPHHPPHHSRGNVAMPQLMTPFVINENR
ncbi:hypothetical protein [Sphingobium sp. YR768]|uniref:hypothetical protein n=1 Tax=Sphingobium sp. YR768 TaxID=1884365 RepID=UPI00115FBFBC|nr:hypothetical protein [Sphingobium sp. YR768]